MRRAAQEHGFTLIELLVSMALALVVFGATLSAFDVFQSNTRFDVLRNEAQDNARNAIDRLARDFRNVAAPKSEPEIPGALERAEPYAVTFQTIRDSAPSKESKNKTNAKRVRYCLDASTPSNEVLWRQVRNWPETAPPVPTATECPDLKGEDWESSSRLAQHITNENGGQKRALFTYGPKGATEVSQILTVEPTIYINVNPSQPRPGETQLTSSVSLRNANRQPTATFTWKLKSLQRVLLNASESVDPDGLALTYKWTEGAKVLPSTAQVWETETGLLSVGNHSITLEVTDPGGLTSKETKVVEVK
ncbi:MAG TPA: prepilin-type N-terminal cleavage/methylation domain-containing protein [Solirubrobacteraceae bacterium]